MLPAVVTKALAPSARVVEIGVGGRFAALEALLAERSDVQAVAIDVDPTALEGAPEGLETHVDDVHEPTFSLYRGADLVFAQRPPVELQPAIARLARSVDADLALRALKDEWADLEAIVGEPTVTSGPAAWRWWPARGGAHGGE